MKYIVLGDLNARSTLWLSESNNTSADVLNEMTLNHDCIMLNTKEATHYSFSRESASILDYCIISSAL